jgi:serine/threonine-protein kinase ATR
MINDPTVSCNASLQVVLPSPASLNEFWPKSQNLVALPHSLQRTIETPLGAIHVSFSLLFALFFSSKTGETKDVGFVTLQQLHTWVLDSCSMLWRFFCRWNTSANRPPLADDIAGSYLQVLEGISCSLTNPRNLSSSSAKTAFVLADGICGMIEFLSTSPLSDVNQLRFATILVRLRGAVVSAPRSVGATSRRLDTSRSMILDVLEPSVINLCQNVGIFATLHKDLKVCANYSHSEHTTDRFQLVLCLWTPPGSWSAEVDDIRNKLCSDMSGNFSDAQLAQESIVVAKLFRESNLADEERSAKRRKTLPSSSNDINGDIYHDLLRIMNGSSHDVLVSNLSNLQNIIQ